jgi:Undecaprenyl-phosphate glucose phosphotransferase
MDQVARTMSDLLASSPADTRVVSPAVALTTPSGSLAPPADDERAITPAVLRTGVRISDYLALVGAGLTAYLLHVSPAPGSAPYYTIAILGLPACALVLFDLLGTYRLDGLKRATGRAWLLAAGWAGLIALLVATAFFTKAGEGISRAWVAYWFVGGLVLLGISRAVIRQLVLRWSADGRLDRRAVIVGGGSTAADLIRALEASKSANIRIVGLFDDRGVERMGVVANYPKLGSIDDLVVFARKTRVDLLIVAIPLTAEARLLQLLKKLWVLPVDIRISALSARLRFRPRAYSWIGDVPFVDVFDRPLQGRDVIVKAVFDRVIGGLALLALSPLMLLTALAIKLDSKGPVLFRQKRYGFNNELIEVFKFRSMYVEKSDATAAKLVTKDDPRVTRVGRFIRKTSIDELPQLFNVVFYGNLSLVGPRPHAVHAKAAESLYQDVVDGYYARHKVRPGITGWAQINGWRGETDTADKIRGRVDCDLDYIERWSPLFDLYILAMTPVSLITKSENAY